jgi:subfamily B ATP-binding cassette protein HlyB/CyaB
VDHRGRQIEARDFVWALGSLCALHRVAFDAELVLREFPPPHGEASFIGAARSLGFRCKATGVRSGGIGKLALPCVLALKPTEDQDVGRLVLLTQASVDQCIIFRSGSNTPETLTTAELESQLAGRAYLLRPQAKAANDADTVGKGSGFGFGWFVPELLKHKRVWRDVLLASLVLQLLALATPLFTQAIIDKVVVHHTQSTLIAIGIGMAVFVVFTALLSWVRQYLVLHTGNRVDAVLGFSVFEHLFKLPPRYFEQRPTGVIAARLHGVETIREFVASAAVTLILDLPFLLICVGVMFWYSQTLTWIAIGILTVIVIASLFMAPIFQARLNEQFLLGARNQAFLTEYVSGIETVKSLQMEPQLRSRYADYLATYLQAGFRTKQIGNTYNVFASTLEQLMTLLILVLGAYTVMTTPAFTIGMLVAFQMFAGKLSQPMLRLVGLWTQFQQASLAVKRLGDVMNAPAEPYRLTPQRMAESKGSIELEGVAFRYRDDLPLLYQDLHLSIRPGTTMAVMGPSGCGKSTLAKLLQGFYLPTQGTIKIDGIDSRHLAANELRSTFGVVPQETVLFSGTVYENLQLANPQATFEQIVQACKMAEIHQVIEQLPKGYQTEIGERGVGLSGGQRQRIAIARALLKRPKVLIFDEATSNLDQQTAEAFARTVNRLRGKVGMFFIAHQLPKSLQVDEVVHLNRGGGQVMRQVKQPQAVAERRHVEKMADGEAVLPKRAPDME